MRRKHPSPGTFGAFSIPHTQNFRNFYQQYGQALRQIAKILDIPELTSYYARHTWATIAASLDIPKETIAAALGYELGNSTTSIYIDYDLRKVDTASRLVIDSILLPPTANK